MRLRPLALGAIFSMSICAPALAQSSSSSEMPTVEVKRDLKLDLSVEEVYDSNIAHTDAATAAARGLHVDDFTTRPLLNIDASQPIGQQILFLQGSAGYDFHAYNSQLNRERFDLEGGIVSPFRSCRATLFGVYKAQQSDLVDIEDLVTTDTDNLFQTVGGTVGAECGGKQGIGGQLMLSHLQTTNSAPLEKLADARTDSATGALTYSNVTLGMIGLTAAYSQSDFPDRPAAILPTAGSRFWTVMTGLTAEHGFGSKLKVSGSASYLIINRDVAPVGIPLRTTGVTYQAIVTYDLSQRIELRADTNHQVTPSNTPGKLYDIVTTSDLYVRYEMGSSFEITLGDALVNSKSNVDTAIPFLVVTDSDTNDVYGSIKYKLRDRASLLLDLRQEARTTNLPQFNYTDTRVTLTAGVTF